MAPPPSPDQATGLDGGQFLDFLFFFRVSDLKQHKLIYPGSTISSLLAARSSHDTAASSSRAAASFV